MLLSVLLIIAILGGMTWYLMAKGLNIFSCNYWPFCHLLLEGNAMTNLDSILKSRDITLPTKVCLVKAMVFPVVMYGCESWTTKKAECWRIDSWESLGLQGDQTNQSILKQIRPEYSGKGRTDAEAETPILWPPDIKNWLIWKDPDAGKDWRQEEKGTTEDEMVR